MLHEQRIIYILKYHPKDNKSEIIHDYLVQQAVTSLDFSDKCLNHKEIVTLWDAIKGTEVEKIDLSWNKIDYRCAHHIISNLKDRPLTELNLSNNVISHLSEEVCDNWCSMLRDSSLIKFSIKNAIKSKDHKTKIEKTISKNRIVSDLREQHHTNKNRSRSVVSKSIPFPEAGHFEEESQHQAELEYAKGILMDGKLPSNIHDSIMDLVKSSGACERNVYKQVDESHNPNNRGLKRKRDVFEEDTTPSFDTLVTAFKRRLVISENGAYIQGHENRGMKRKRSNSFLEGSNIDYLNNGNNGCKKRRIL